MDFKVILSKGDKLYLKRVGEVEVTDVCNDSFKISVKNKNYKMLFSDIGKTVFFLKEHETEDVENIKKYIQDFIRDKLIIEKEKCSDKYKLLKKEMVCNLRKERKKLRKKWNKVKKRIEPKSINQKAFHRLISPDYINDCESFIKGSCELRPFVKIIVVNQRNCINKRHNTETVSAQVPYLNRFGERKYKYINIFYCKKCQIYYVHERTLNAGKYRYLIRKIRETDTYLNKEGLTKFREYIDLKPESLLMQCGYKVNEKDNYSSEQRQQILCEIMLCRVMTMNDIVSHINFLIRLNETNYKMALSRSKWQNDLNFLSEYNIDHHRKVRGDLYQ